jgi:hypothetical protein
MDRPVLLTLLCGCRGVSPGGQVRVENLEDATHHVDPVLRRVKPEYLVSEGHVGWAAWEGSGVCPCVGAHVAGGAHLLPRPAVMLHTLVDRDI